jgi:hypothetical protein
MRRFSSHSLYSRIILAYRYVYRYDIMINATNDQRPTTIIDYQRHFDLDCETYLSLQQSKEYYILIDHLRYRNRVDQTYT